MSTGFCAPGSLGAPRARRVATCALPERLGGAARELSKLPILERYARLAELGAQLETPEEVRAEIQRPEFRVPGCSSVVHVRAQARNDGRVDVHASSDAKLTAGLLHVLIDGLSELSKGEVLEVSFAEFAEEAGLGGLMSSSRSLAFGNVLDSIHKQLRGEGARTTAGAEARSVLVDAQGADVAVLLSGGVDSSVSLRLLIEQGLRPVPFYLKIWLEDELAHLGDCPWEEDLRYATQVCDQVGLAVEPVSLQKDYWEQVVEYTVRSARTGNTPNPDVMCNSRIKFGVFLDRIGGGFPKVASGHYAVARQSEADGLTELVCSADEVKDQTYFLAHLTQSQVAKATFPIGGFTKPQVRELARRFELPNMERRDSQGICFLGKLRFDEFLEHHLGRHPGAFVEYETGVELGQHRGFWFYTLGQRKGLGLSGGPWYVVSKDAERNIVYISGSYDALQGPRKSFAVDTLSWISGRPPSPQKRDQLRVKVRHGPRSSPCRLALAEGRGVVELEQPDSVGLAPGQFAAFYDGDVCVGSGVICSDAALDLAPVANGAKASKRLQAHYMT